MRLAVPGDQGQAAAVARDGAGSRSPELNIGEFIRILIDRRLSIAGSTLVFTLIAALYAFTATPMYTATNTLLFDTRPRGLLGAEGQLASIATDLALVESQVKLLSSDTVLRRVVESERLAQDDEFGGGSGGMRGALMQMIGLKKSSGEENGDRTTIAARNLSKAVIVKRSERTYVVEVDVTSRDAAKSARIANAIAVAYVADQMDARSDTSRRESGLLRNKLEEVQARVRDAERRVAEYKEANRIYTADGKLVNELQLSEASEALVAARSNVSQLKARYEQVQRVLRQGQSPEQLADSLRSGVIEKLRQQYGEIIRSEANLRITLGPRHPQYLEVQEQLQRTRQLINEELKRITQAAFNDYQIAQNNARQMEREAETLKQQSSATNQTIVRLRELEREFEGSKTVLDRFLRLRESMGIDALETLSARVIAQATPPAGPSAPRKAPILAIAMLAGLGFGVARALVGDFIARQGGQTGTMGAHPSDLPRSAAADMLRQNAGAQLPRRISLPLIASGGLAGRLGRKPDAGSLLTEAVLHSAGPYAQVVNDLVGRLPHGGTGLTLLVAGTEPHLGATTLASNIGWAAAARGLSVLLVDGDLARPALSGASGAQPLLGSLTLEGRPTLVRCLGPDWHTGPLLVPVLTRTEIDAIDAPGAPAPVELDRMGLSFDLVVIDGPAISFGRAFADLAGAADSLVLLIRAGADAALPPQAMAMPEALTLVESPLVRTPLAKRLPGFRKAA